MSVVLAEAAGNVALFLAACALAALLLWALDRATRG